MSSTGVMLREEREVSAFEDHRGEEESSWEQTGHGELAGCTWRVVRNSGCELRRGTGLDCLSSTLGAQELFLVLASGLLK